MSKTIMLELLESGVWGPGSQMRRNAIFSNRDDPKWAEKKRLSDFKKKSAFVEDVHGVAVFRKCKLDRIPKLAEKN